MTGLNRIFLMGYLGNAPTINVSRKGTPYTTLAIASPRKASETDKLNGRSGVEWHQVRVWGKQGELCAKFLNKGRVVLVEGYLSQYALEKAGKTERRTSINALRVDWLPHADASGLSGGSAHSPEDNSDEQLPLESPQESQSDSAVAT